MRTSLGLLLALALGLAAAATACDLNPQPLPPGATPTANDAGRAGDVNGASDAAANPSDSEGGPIFNSDASPPSDGGVIDATPGDASTPDGDAGDASTDGAIADADAASDALAE
jgi:hypothetical protein